MKYFKCYEEVLVGPDKLHFYTTDEAIQFIMDMFRDDGSVYRHEFMIVHTQPPEVYIQKYLDEQDEDALMAVLLLCFEYYGFTTTIVDLEIEPWHIYQWNEDVGIWALDDIDMAMI